MNTLSIDFGTSYCTASYLNAEGQPCPVCFGYNQYNAKCYKIPTVIQYAILPNGDERKIIGESALFNLIQSNQSDSSIVSKIKTELRERTGYVINGKPKKSVTIVSDILQNIKDVAEKDAGRVFTHLILTHPAQYEAIKLQLLESAASSCGFSHITLLEEPKAAAYAFIRKHNIQAKKGAIVFDYGGGTIDIAYLWIESPTSLQFKFQPVGQSKCGGEYIDLALHNRFAKDFGYSDTNHVSPILLDHCNRIKINFGLKDEQDLILNNKVKVISSSDFENIISSNVDVSLKLLSKVIDKCAQNDYPINYVFLNGGSSRLNLVKRSILTMLPNAEIIHYDDDDIAVAIGALLSMIKAPKVKVIDSSLDKIRELFKNSKQ